MQINGKCVDIEFEIDVPKKDGGSYVGTTLTYKDTNGKVQSKSWVQTALNHAANAHVKAALKTLAKGSNFTAEAVKNDAGFWNWTDIKIVAEHTAQSSPTSQKSTWQGETPEERAERRALDKEKFAFEKEKQKLIIRQSSLSNAISLLKGSNDETVENVLSVAKQFEAYVLGGEV